MNKEVLPIEINGKSSQGGKILLIWIIVGFSFLNNWSLHRIPESLKHFNTLKSFGFNWSIQVIIFFGAYYLTSFLKSYKFILTENDYSFEYRLFSQDYAYVIVFKEIESYFLYSTPSLGNVLEVKFKAGHTGRLAFPKQKLQKPLEKQMGKLNIPTTYKA